MAHRIKCGHCRGSHETKREVFFCARPKAQSQLANTRVQPVNQPRPNEWQTTVPRAMVEAMRDGRYAAAPFGGDDFASHVFFRVWRPTSGKRKGCLLIKTQHSDAYRDFITIYPSGSVWFAQRGQKLDMALLMVCADPFTSAMKYARLHKVCSRCGKKLTDNRSRWYGIGPECEGYWPEIINMVNETKGVFHR